MSIRWADVKDAYGVATVHVASWRSAYPGLIAQHILDGLSISTRAEAWTRLLSELAFPSYAGPAGTKPHRLLIAECGNRIVGWASFGAGRDEGSSDQGELAGLYVHPDFWSKKVGHALMLNVEQELAADGFQSAYLWVLFGNDRAASFYESHGWRTDGGEKIGDAGGTTELREVRHVTALNSAKPPTSSA